MTRQDAWDLLNQAKSKAAEHFLGAPVCHMAFHPNVFSEMVDALKPPTPDPDTGLVSCGCGGKASMAYDNEVGKSVVTYALKFEPCTDGETWYQHLKRCGMEPSHVEVKESTSLDGRKEIVTMLRWTEKEEKNGD